MKRNRPTCSPWLHARFGEQLGLSPRSSGRVGGLSVGAQRTRRSSMGVRLPGRDSRKPSNASNCRPYQSSGAPFGRPCLPCRYPATRRELSATPVEIKRHHDRLIALLEAVSNAIVENRLGDPEFQLRLEHLTKALCKPPDKSPLQ